MLNFQALPAETVSACANFSIDTSQPEIWLNKAAIADFKAAIASLTQ
ncbi:MAG: hypothetical protein AAGG51_01025 [Cyanobacteria bacterium P01_G01_bin.54]